MTISKLSTYTRISPNTSGIRGNKVTKITVHHMAGNCSVETCGEIFANPSRQASSNYGIGTDGRIGCYLPEEYHPWTSSSYWNDDRAITIEVANTTAGVMYGTWAVSDAAFDSLVDLCADICKRYDFTLVFTGDSSGSLTRHNFYANTNCPGPYLEAKTAELVKRVNAKVRGEDMLDKNDINNIWAFDNNKDQQGQKGTAWRNLMDTNRRVQAIEKKLDIIIQKLEPQEDAALRMKE